MIHSIHTASDTDTSHIPNVKIPDQDTHPGDGTSGDYPLPGDRLTTPIALIDQIPQPKRSSTFGNSTQLLWQNKY